MSKGGGGGTQYGSGQRSTPAYGGRGMFGYDPSMASQGGSAFGQGANYATNRLNQMPAPWNTSAQSGQFGRYGGGYRIGPQLGSPPMMGGGSTGAGGTGDNMQTKPLYQGPADQAAPQMSGPPQQPGEVTFDDGGMNAQPEPYGGAMGPGGYGVRSRSPFDGGPNPGMMNPGMGGPMRFGDAMRPNLPGNPMGSPGPTDANPMQQGQPTQPGQYGMRFDGGWRNRFGMNGGQGFSGMNRPMYGGPADGANPGMYGNPMMGMNKPMALGQQPLDPSQGLQTESAPAPQTDQQRFDAQNQGLLKKQTVMDPAYYQSAAPKPPPMPPMPTGPMQQGQATYYYGAGPGGDMYDKGNYGWNPSYAPGYNDYIVSMYQGLNPQQRSQVNWGDAVNSIGQQSGTPYNSGIWGR